jgi:hypothetical protein
VLNRKFVTAGAFQGFGASASCVERHDAATTGEHEMKHMKSLTKLPAQADDYTPATVSIATLMTFLVAVMTALEPVLAAKFPTTT